MPSFAKVGRTLRKEQDLEFRRELEKFILELLLREDPKPVSTYDILDELEVLFESEDCTRRERRRKIGELDWIMRDAISNLCNDYVVRRNVDFDLVLLKPEDKSKPLR